jgi:hypothetical protein
LFFVNLLSSSPSPGKDPHKTLKETFKPLCFAEDEASETLRDGISFFLSQYIDPKGKDGRPKLGMGVVKFDNEDMRDLVAGRVKLLKKLLSEGKTSASF